MNVCTFIGRLGRDPEMKYTTNGKAVAYFSMAVQRDGKKDETDWISFVAWEKTAELIANYCHKGDLIGVTGALQQRDWTDKDGNKRTTFEVKVNRIDFCGSKKSEQSNDTPAVEKAGVFQPITEADGELPF